MIDSISALSSGRWWCEHCKRKCFGCILKPYLVTSTEGKEMVLCNACLDLAASEAGIIPEDF